MYGGMIVWMRVKDGKPLAFGIFFFSCILDYISLVKAFEIWAFHSWSGGLYSPRTFVHFSLTLEMWPLLALGHASIIHL
jgi:hypothetical protein